MGSFGSGGGLKLAKAPRSGASYIASDGQVVHPRAEDRAEQATTHVATERDYMEGRAYDDPDQLNSDAGKFGD